jgi:hypothetical protein
MSSPQIRREEESITCMRTRNKKLLVVTGTDTANTKCMLLANGAASVMTLSGTGIVYRVPFSLSNHMAVIHVTCC